MRKLTLDNVRAFGLLDGGVVATDMRADLNVIALDEIGVGMPRVVHIFVDDPNGVTLELNCRGS